MHLAHITRPCYQKESYLINKMTFNKVMSIAPTKMYYIRQIHVNLQFEDSSTYNYIQCDGISILE